MTGKLESRNWILAKLNKLERESIISCMELFDIEPREVLYEPDRAMENAYFPESGIMSIVTLIRDGPSVEAATVGYEGMVGIPLVLGSDTTTTTRAFCQISGRVWRISADDLHKQMRQSPTLCTCLFQYAQTLFDLLAQSTACNRLHSIEERCARWLLLTHDRMDSDTYQLTQESLATMLGVRRAGVSLVAQTLQSAGLIEYRHGKVTIKDRENLETVSCECYSVVRKAYEKLNHKPLTR